MHLGAWCVEEIPPSAKLGSQRMLNASYFPITHSERQAYFLIMY